MIGISFKMLSISSNLLYILTPLCTYIMHSDGNKREPSWEHGPAG